MVRNLPKFQSARTTRFMPSYFEPGNSQCGSDMPIMVSVQLDNVDNVFKIN